VLNLSKAKSVGLIAEISNTSLSQTAAYDKAFNTYQAHSLPFDTG
jgi:hypothetical protein